MTNPNNKIKKRINVIDVIIILLVLALIGTVIFRIYQSIGDGSSKKGSNYIVSFECSAEYDTLTDYLKNGEKVYLSTNKSLIGYIYDDPDDEHGAVYEIPYDVEEETEEGETGVPSKAESENHNNEAYRVVRLAGKLKLSSEAVKAKSGDYYTVKGRNITVGSVLEVYTDEAVFTIVVKSITKAGK
jgi:hypothetical protein